MHYFAYGLAPTAALLMPIVRPPRKSFSSQTHCALSSHFLHALKPHRDTAVGPLSVGVSTVKHGSSGRLASHLCWLYNQPPSNPAKLQAAWHQRPEAARG